MAAGAGVFQVDPAFRIVNRQHCGFYVWRVEVLSLHHFNNFMHIQPYIISQYFGRLEKVIFEFSLIHKISQLKKNIAHEVVADSTALDSKASLSS